MDSTVPVSSQLSLQFDHAIEGSIFENVAPTILNTGIDAFHVSVDLTETIVKRYIVQLVLSDTPNEITL